MITQTGIFLFGVIAAWLTQQGNERLKKYACIFGLLSQPFWFYAALQTNQWGMFLLSIIYTGVWLIGFRNYWIKPVSPPQVLFNKVIVVCDCGQPAVENESFCVPCKVRVMQALSNWRPLARPSPPKEE